jgi:tRNA(Ile)-lysidine synthase
MVSSTVSATAGSLPPGADDLLARCRFPPAGTAVTCAVSGGADSLALLALATAAGCEVTAVHVDHGLRPGSGADADVVQAAAERFGAGFRSVQVHVEPGPNLEARARSARYQVLPADVLTGHTADDQAETVLLNLLRGTGLDGLAAMRPERPDGPRRPLLGLRRADTRALCAALGLHPVEDPSNTDRSLLRNQIRHDLLPLLAAAAHRDLVPLWCRQAELVADDVELLDELAGGLDPTDARALATAHPALARRAVRRWLRPAGDGHPPDAAAVERVLAVARGTVLACELVGGWRVHRSGQRLHLTAPPDSR